MLAAAGLLIVLGLFGGKLVGKIHMPSITGWILVGLVLGPSVFNVVTGDIAQMLQPIEGLALAIIALAIGGELSVSSLRKLGSSIITITIVQMLMTFLCVFGATYLFGASLPLALVFGAMSAATAPGATVAVLHELRAKGPLTHTLLAVVALDDAFTILLFGIVMSFVEAMVAGGSVAVTSFVAPLLEIAFSVLLGVIMGFIGIFVLDRLRRSEEILPFVIGLALLVAGLATKFNLSLLLAAMVTVANFSTKPRIMFETLQQIEAPIYILFFSLAGAKLHLSALRQVGLLGASYIVGRTIGKLGGSYLGAVLAKAPETVRKYLGFAMLPQAGVAIGLAIVAVERLPELGGVIMTTTLAAVVVYEIIGPLGAKYALTQANETNVPRGTRKESVSG
ncbi:MAG: cation:proton antiporter [Limnochordia bacterium]|jgi:Kef-type K+ transport system membrane component KefB